MALTTSTTTSLYERFRWAEDLFARRDNYAAVRVLQELVADLTAESDGAGVPTAVRELLARAYYHSAQLGRAEEASRALLADDPTNAYAALLLARTLQRRSRAEDAEAALRLATALGAPGTTPSPTPGTETRQETAA